MKFIMDLSLSFMMIFIGIYFLVNSLIMIDESYSEPEPTCYISPEQAMKIFK